MFQAKILRWEVSLPRYVKFCNKFLVRLHGEYNTSLALWKHHVNLLWQSLTRIQSSLCTDVLKIFNKQIRLQIYYQRV